MMKNRKARKALQLEIRRKVARMPYVDPYAPCDASVLHARVGGLCSSSQYYSLRSENKIHAHGFLYSTGMQRLIQFLMPLVLQLPECSSRPWIFYYEIATNT